MMDPRVPIEVEVKEMAQVEAVGILFQLRR